VKPADALRKVVPTTSATIAIARNSQCIVESLPLTAARAAEMRRS